MKKYLDKLNDAQRRAVMHGRDPLLVVAGAGTGKTTMLAHRVASLIIQGVSPERILLLTFTRRAANELISRAISVANRAVAEMDEESAFSWAVSASKPNIWGGTFHGIAARLLRKYGPGIGLSDNFSILDRSDAEDVMNVVRADMNLETEKARFPKKSTCMNIYSRVVNSRQKLAQVLLENYPNYCDYHDQLGKLFSLYRDRKHEDSTLDYDDLLLYWESLLKHPTVGKRVRSLFDWVLVDEYQDTNVIQAEILKGLTPDGQGLSVVGDDAQAIYGFRAATVRNILDFPAQFPKVTIIPLEENYRSTSPILHASNEIISQLKERYQKKLRAVRVGGQEPVFIRCADEESQAEYVVKQILKHFEEGISFKEQAVLFRSSHHSIKLEVELNRRKIPYTKYGGLKFTEAAHVKDMLSFLRVAENPADISAGMRMLCLLPGIGSKKARQLMDIIRASGGNWDVWQQWNAPKNTQYYWSDLVTLMKTLTGSEDLNVPTVQTQLRSVLTFYEPILQETYELDSKSRENDLEQVVEMGSRFQNRREILSDFVLDAPTSSEEFSGIPDKDDDYLILSTIHSAKGLEWRSVSVLHASDGNIPSDFSTDSMEKIDEELRLFYVALTRAKDYLYVLCPMRYYHQTGRLTDSYSRSLPSRFLTPEILRDCFKSEHFSCEEDPIEETLKDDGFSVNEWYKKQTEDLW